MKAQVKSKVILPAELCFGICCPHHDCIKYVELDGATSHDGRRRQGTCAKSDGTHPEYKSFRGTEWRTAMSNVKPEEPKPNENLSIILDACGPMDSEDTPDLMVGVVVEESLYGRIVFRNKKHIGWVLACPVGFCFELRGYTRTYSRSTPTYDTVDDTIRALVRAAIHFDSEKQACQTKPAEIATSLPPLPTQSQDNAGPQSQCP